MPKVPSKRELTEFKLRKALVDVLRKLGLTTAKGVPETDFLVKLAKQYTNHKLVTIKVQPSKLDRAIAESKKAKVAQKEFDLGAWQATLTIPDGYCELDIPF